MASRRRIYPLAAALSAILALPIVATEMDDIVPIGGSVSGEKNTAVPSSGFAQVMMFTQAKVTTLEPGVLAIWADAMDFPHRIYVQGDTFEAFGLCTKRVRIGCWMSYFDYDEAKVTRYLMPLQIAGKKDTYDRLKDWSYPEKIQGFDITPSVTQPVPANLHMSAPSTMFARTMVARGSGVHEIEQGVIEIPGNSSGAPRAIFASWNGFDAFGECDPGENTRCAMSVFDYERREITDYEMPSAAAVLRSTYIALVAPRPAS